MAASLKHIGKMSNTGSKILIVFRTVPGESNQALVLPVAQLPDSYHDSIMKLVESQQAQDAFELGEIMFSRTFPDGRPMLAAMQADGRLHKVATDLVLMTPGPNAVIKLSELNVLIAEQKNCTIDDLYTFVSGAPRKDTKKEAATIKDVTPSVDTDIPAPVRAQASNTEVLTDKDIAKSYRSQADAMYKEAAKLRKQADDLDPPAKKTTKTKEEASA
jgi:hypothetical protein